MTVRTETLLRGAGCVGIAALAVLVISRADETTPSTPRPGPTRERLEVVGREERTLRAREDVEVLELQLGAKRARVQQADLRLKLERALKDHAERNRKKGHMSPLDERRAELDVLEAEEHLARRKAEYAEIEARFNRARRRVAHLQSGGGVEIGFVESLADDVDDLKRRMDRLEGKFDVVIEDVGRTEEVVRALTTGR